MKIGKRHKTSFWRKLLTNFSNFFSNFKRDNTKSLKMSYDYELKNDFFGGRWGWVKLKNILSCLSLWSASMPGSAPAIRRKSWKIKWSIRNFQVHTLMNPTSRLVTCFTLYPAFADVSINITFSSFALRSPSSVDTCLKFFNFFILLVFSIFERAKHIKRERATPVQNTRIHQGYLFV